MARTSTASVEGQVPIRTIYDRPDVSTAHDGSTGEDDPSLAKYSPSLRRHIIAARNRDPSELSPHEIFWRDLQPWLEQRGYRLRPRYKPDWVPVWKGTTRFPWDYEDGMDNSWSQVLDAVRISDGEMVMLKRIRRYNHPYEVEVSKLFTEEPLRSHPRNHCVPVFEVLDLPDERDVSLLVLPLLRVYNDPAFQSVGEAVEYFRQIFEGLQFMHQCHVAHRDCTSLNIMMDPRPMYPKMYHPASTDRKLDDWDGTAKYYSRTTRPVKYYLIDFGLSRIYDASDASPREDPIWGRDKTVPEFQTSDDPCDPFPTDIYYLGSMIRKDFLKKSRSFAFMSPLVNDMVQADPTKRPTIDQVVARFEQIYRKLPWWVLRSRPAEEDEPRIVRIIYSTIQIVRASIHVVTFRAPIPRPRQTPLHTFSY